MDQAGDAVGGGDGGASGGGAADQDHVTGWRAVSAMLCKSMPRMP